MTTAPSGPELRLGGHLVVDALIAHGVDMVFGVPGESYLAVLDGLHDTNSVRAVMCRHEGGAAMMAEAYGKLTGRPGVCMVTRGPGATNASSGMHVGFQDSTPMVLLIGQVGRSMADREAFQEIDYRLMYGPLAKWVAQVEDAERLPEYISRAFHTATSGRPGPVVLALPEDMLTSRVVARPFDSYRAVEPHPGPDALRELHALLAGATAPLLMLGGGGWDRESCTRIREFAEASDLPVCVSFRCQDYFDNRHANYVGHVGIGAPPALRELVASADPLVVIGAALGEITTDGYSLLEVPRPRQRLVHVHPGAEMLGRVYQADLAINASPRALAGALAGMGPVDGSTWADRTRRANLAYRATLEPKPVPGPVQMGEIAAWLNARLPEDAVICNGAGNYATWMHRYYQYRGYRTQLAPTSGSMGYGMPAAVAAKLVHPDRVVLSMNGDGCFMMHGQELATAMQYGADIIAIVVNNAMFGTIRMHQEREYPGRVSATGLENPDFAALARAYGAHGETVCETGEFAPAFERALAAGRPGLIEIRLDPEAITPATSLSAIREAARAAGR